MTRFARISALLILVCLFPVTAGAEEPEVFSIVEPADKSLVDSSFITVSLKIIDPEIDSVTISNKEKYDAIKVTVTKGKDALCKTIPLGTNKNRIVVTAYKGETPAAAKTVTVLNISDISRKYKTAPPEYKQTPFHTKEREAACVRCHTLNITDKDRNPAAPLNSVCYPCHNKITEYKYVHGPAATWECFTCHSSDSSPVKYAITKLEKEICFTCHDAERVQWEAREFMHGPTATGKCSICHNPHASSHRYWLKTSSWQLCVSCHVDMGSGKKKHVLRLFALVEDHPTKGFRDPRNQKEKLSCVSCHNPHVSQFQTLLAFDGKSIFAFCNQCHMK